MHAIWTRRVIGSAQQVAELASALGLPETPSDSDVETAAERIEAARARERTLEEDRRRRAAALARRRVAHESLRQSRRRSSRPNGPGSATGSAAHGLGAPLSPDGVLESLSALQAAWKDLGALDRVDAKIAQRRGEIAEFEARIAELAAGLRELGGPAESLETDPADTLEDLCASLEEVLERRATGRTSLLRASRRPTPSWNARSVSATMLGRLRAELEPARCSPGTEEQARLAQARSEAQRPPGAAGAGPSGRFERAAGHRRPRTEDRRARATAPGTRARARRGAQVLGRPRMCALARSNARCGGTSRSASPPCSPARASASPR